MTTGETDRHAGRRTDICSQSEVGSHLGSCRLLAAEMFTLIFTTETELKSRSAHWSRMY